MKGKVITLIGCILLISLISTVSFAGERDRSYEVTVTNITKGQNFTPILVVIHKKGVQLFTPGSPASAELAMLAEGGDTAPLTGIMSMNPGVGEITTTGGILGPGQTRTITVPAEREFTYISLAAMLLPTNDGFIALNGVALPRDRRALMYLSPAYDAGSEMNDELCQSIPGGAMCAGEGYNKEDGEGYVHIHAGIHGIGDVDAPEHDWRNPVARILIRSGHGDERASISPE